MTLHSLTWERLLTGCPERYNNKVALTKAGEERLVSVIMVMYDEGSD